MIGERALSIMKPSAYLINTARGALIDEAALVRAVEEAWIAGAALDVLATEPPPSDHPLLHMVNVTVTPHAAFYSEQAVADVVGRQRATWRPPSPGHAPTIWSTHT
jgi:D-3-phosphoglycerate dehydrogenase / 2-oxoglutarate reductase